MSVSDALGSAKHRLTDIASSASADAELLLAHVLERDRTWLVAHGEEPLSREVAARFEALVVRRAQGAPIAYLTGEAWFYGRRFEITPAVLIPRPETEHLIDEALAFLRDFRTHDGVRAPVVLDVGTGSGAIACTLAAELPDATIYATDVSEAALAVAKQNAATLRMTEQNCHPERSERVSASEVEGPTRRTAARITFERADLLPTDATLKFDCVIANLPYIPTAELPQSPDPVSFEPREALDGGPDGLREYRRLLEFLPPRLNPGALVLLEAAPPTIAGLRVAALPCGIVTVGTDYAGLDRYVAIWTDA